MDMYSRSQKKCRYYRGSPSLQNLLDMFTADLKSRLCTCMRVHTYVKVPFANFYFPQQLKEKLWNKVKFILSENLQQLKMGKVLFNKQFRLTSLLLIWIWWVHCTCTYVYATLYIYITCVCYIVHTCTHVFHVYVCMLVNGNELQCCQYYS